MNHKRPHFKTLTLITVFAVVLNLILSLQSVSAVDEATPSSTFVFPKIGSDSLLTPEYYPSAVQKKETLALGPLQVETPDRVEDLGGNFYGFSLKAESVAQLTGITYTVKFADGSESARFAVEIADAAQDKDGKPVTTGFSEPVLMSKGITAVSFYYDNPVSFEVKKYEFIKSGYTPQATGAELSGAYAEYKRSFLEKTGLTLVTRDEYGAPPDNIYAPGFTPPYYAVNRIVVHHTATGVDLTNTANTVASIYRYHTYTQEWGDIGYNYLIDPFGKVFEGRAGGNGVRGNHAPPNEGSIGISLIGNFTVEGPTQAAIESLIKLTAYLSEINKFDLTYKTAFNSEIPGAGVYPHQAVNATACPGASFLPLLPKTIATAQEYRTWDKTLNALVDQYLTKYRPGSMTEDKDSMTEILLQVDKLSPALKLALLQKNGRVIEAHEVAGMLVLRIPVDLAKQFLTELNLVVPEAVAQPNYTYKPSGWNNTSPTRSVPTDYSVTRYWNLEKIKAPEAWKVLGGCVSNNSCGGSETVKIAVLDTGIAYEEYDFITPNYQDLSRGYHLSPELNRTHFTGGYDAYQDYLMNEVRGCPAKAADTDPLNDCLLAETEKVHHGNDDHGHGTAVASVISANTGDLAPNLAVGIAHNVSIVPVKVYYPNNGSMGENMGVANTLFVRMGIDYARSVGAKVINMSLGGPMHDPAIEVAINNAYAAGIILVAASGNDNTGVFYPAAYANVIAVGASTPTNTKASYSNYGPALDMVAPVGDGIPVQSLSCWATKPPSCHTINDLDTFSSSTNPLNASGTSFAAPQVAAAIALLKSQNSALSNNQIKSLLYNSATDILVKGRDNESGYGIVNLQKTLETFANISLPELSSISPNSGKAKGGYIATVTGTNFQPGISVRLGSNIVPADKISYTNTTRFSFVVPDSLSGGPTDLQLTNPDTYFTTDENAFTYLSPLQNFSPKSWLRTGPYNWGITNTKFITSGDYNGDGKSEVAAMYDYGKNDMSMIVFTATGETFASKSWFRTGPNNWGVPYTKFVTSGDYNNDGKDEIAAMYDYGNNDMAVIIFTANGEAFSTTTWFRSGPNNWGVPYTKFVSTGDYNADGKDEIAAMYDYGRNDMAIIVFNAVGQNFSTRTWFRSGVNNWGVPYTKYVNSGDFNADGRDDLTAMYDYGNNDMSMIVFTGNGSSFTSKSWFRTGPNNWGVPYTKYVNAGDFNHDGKSEIAAMYDYGKNDMAMIVFKGVGETFRTNTWFRSGVNNWGVSYTKFVTPGDYNNDGYDDLAAIYDYGQQDMSVIVFK